jgi:hypothetical protein
MRSLTIITALALLTAGFGQRVAAYVASSTSYRLERDSINFGGALSSSTNYSLEDTAGEIATGRSTSTNYSIEAGYQQTDVSISLTSAPDVTLLPTIVSLVGGSATGTASWTVTTDNPAGYTLGIRASTNPALSSGSSSFANYTPAAATPDFSWSVAASASEFGFTPEGSDLASAYKDNGSACGVGALDTNDACWDSIVLTDKTISQRASSNSPSGTQTSVLFMAEAGASAGIAAGAYSAVITVTASAL